MLLRGARTLTSRRGGLTVKCPGGLLFRPVTRRLVLNQLVFADL